MEIIIKFTYWLTVGKFKITSKNFSRTTSRAASLIVGLAAMSSVFLYPFAAILFFFKKAAENPEAQTYKARQSCSVIYRHEKRKYKASFGSTTVFYLHPSANET